MTIRFLPRVFREPASRASLEASRTFASMGQPTTDSSAQSADFGHLAPSPKKVPKSVSPKTKKAKPGLKVVGDGELGKKEAETTAVSDAQERSVVLRKPIPKNFIKETLLPHLEHNVAYNCMKFPPEVVLQLGIAYSKLPHFLRQRSIEDALVEAFRYRAVDFSGSECLQLMNTSMDLQGLRSPGVYLDLLDRLEVPHVYSSLNSLNRLGICRSIARIIRHSQEINAASGGHSGSVSVTQQGNKAQNSSGVPNSDHDSEHTQANSDAPGVHGSKEGPHDPAVSSAADPSRTLMHGSGDRGDVYRTSILRPWSYVVKGLRDRKIADLLERLITFCENRILPQLEYELKSFDSDELTDLLAVLAQRTERDGSTLDFPVVSILMANIMRLYPSTSLVNSLNNLASLCRLRVRHDGFLELVLADLRNPQKVTNIYHKHLSRTIWSLARFDLLEGVMDSLGEQVARNVPKFSPSCFARLAQVDHYHPVRNPQLRAAFKADLEKVCLCLLSRLDTFSPKDLTFFLSGLLHTALLPTESEFTDRRVRELKPKFEKDQRYLPKKAHKSDTFLIKARLLERVRVLESEFDLWEIERLLEAVRSFPDFAYLQEHLPESWDNIVHPKEESD